MKIPSLSIFLFIILIISNAIKASSPTPQALTETAVEWDFDGGTEGWVFANNLSGVTVESVLKLDILGGDPHMYSANNLNINGANGKFILIRLKNATTDDRAQIFWSTEGAPGISEANSISFNLKPNDNDFTEYIIKVGEKPGWNAIVQQLRFDPVITASSGTIEIDYIKIVDNIPSLTWDFENDAEGWEFTNNVSGGVSAGNLKVTILAGDPFISLNNLNISPETYPWLEIRMRNNTSDSVAQFFWFKQDDYDAEFFEINPNDTAYTSYIIALYKTPGWAGIINGLRLDLADRATSGSSSIDYIRLLTERPEMTVTHVIPGVIEAEEYKEGGEGVGYHDSDAINNGGQYRPDEGVDIQACSEGGYNVGWLSQGEWMAYEIEVEKSGLYRIDARTASAVGTGKFHITLGSGLQTKTISVINTGGDQNWTTVSDTLELNAGAYEMKVFVETGNFNLNSFGFTEVEEIATVEELRDTYSDTWVVTDGLGRKAPTHREAGGPKANKTLAVFYYMWHEYHEDASVWGPWDNTAVIKENPANPQYGPQYMFHWWGEPVFGFYNNTDEYVIAKHAQMLTDAGVDAWFFDVTNAATYDYALEKIFKVLNEIKATGRKVPKIAFITNTKSASTIQHLYETIYSKEKEKELWFYWDGKPLMLGSTEGINPEVLHYFTFRKTWAWNAGQDNWTWLDTYPQRPGYHTTPDMPEQISVSAASHPNNNIGKSFHNGSQPPIDEYGVTPRTPEGLYFAEQWSRALKVDPPLVLATQWNEWIAQRFICGIDFCGTMTDHESAPGETVFVDALNAEYNRDMEPNNGINKDHYYYQLVANARKYKGVRPIPVASGQSSIKLNKDMAQWDIVGPEFRDDIGDVRHRDTYGYTSAVRYVNKSGRNDIELAKVTYDKSNVYFYVKTADVLTSESDENWMTLFIDIDHNTTTGWEGYDYVINRSRNGAVCSVEKNTGGWSWQKVADARYEVDGAELHIRIHLSDLGLEENQDNISFDFKWADNLPSNPKIMDFIDQGDVAPNNRFNYRFITEEASNTLTKVQKVKHRDSIHLYPNPAESTLTIDLGLVAFEWLTLNIYDFNGKSLYSRELKDLKSKGKFSLDISTFPKGIYSLVITSKSKRISEKIIIK